MEAVGLWLDKVSGWVWGIPLLVLLFGTHLFLTLRLRLIQLYLPKAIRLSFRRKTEGKGDVSHFGALLVALAATIGTGNIVGVATAVSVGGPGAVLWMWLTGVFGIATKYGEAVLSVKYRVVNERGEMAGGPMYVLERGLNARWLGLIFAALTAVAAFGIGNTVQANSVAHNLERVFIETFGMNPSYDFTARAVIGVVMAVITAAALLGGVKSIAKVCTALVPFMAVFYIIGCLILLFVHMDRLPSTIALILNSAFTGHAAVGGFLGAGMKQAMQFGIARGLFSNESGLGSAPIVAAAAQTRNPVRQALVSATGTFWDTVVICLMTGLVVVNSGMWLQEHKSVELTQMAFSDLGWLGPLVLTIGLATFVFSTILGWSYYGEKAIEYLFGTKAIFPYRIAWVIAVFIGAVAELKPIWAFADIANGLMAIPNLIALLLLSHVIVDETRKYLWNGNLDLDCD